LDNFFNGKTQFNRKIEVKQFKKLKQSIINHTFKTKDWEENLWEDKITNKKCTIEKDIIIPIDNKRYLIKKDTHALNILN
jgi:hypothetical protein